MDQNEEHQVLIEIRCALTAKIFRINRDQLPKKNAASFVQAVVRSSYEQAKLVRLNQPFIIDSEKYLTIILIRHAVDEDDVWQSSTVNLVRKNWGLMFINQTGNDITVDIYPDAKDDEGKQTKVWSNPSIGMVHTQKFILRSVSEE